MNGLKNLTQELLIEELFRRIDFTPGAIATSSEREFANLVPSPVAFREAVRAEAARREEAANATPV